MHHQIKTTHNTIDIFIGDYGVCHEDVEASRKSLHQIVLAPKLEQAAYVLR